MIRYRHIAVMVLIVLGVAPAWQIAAAQTPSPQDDTLPGQIAYPVFDPERNIYDIYLANADGSDRQVIVTDASAPDLSPDCNQIVFRSWEDAQRAIFVRQLSGTDRRMLTTQAHAEDTLPTWSPDGRLIAFTSRREADRRSRIYLTGSDAKGDRAATIGDDQVFGNTPDWLPDERLMFAGCTGNDSGLLAMNPDGTDPLLLTNHPGDRAPVASPDGTRVAFMSNRDGNWEVYTTPAEGGEVVRLTENPANDGLPAWSPDGRYIAFASDRGGQWGIWIMRPDGSAQRELWALEGPLDSPLSEQSWLDENISWVSCKSGEASGAEAGKSEAGSVLSLFPPAGQPCEIQLLEPELMLGNEEGLQMRFEWQIDRPLAPDEYYVLFVGGILDGEPHLKGSFWDPVLENWGPWSLEILETMAPLLELVDLRDPVFETLIPIPDSGILHWEVQVRHTGRSSLPPSPIDAVVCKGDRVMTLGPDVLSTP